jgi:drug/metabolite transporter (DMT)-like permease
LDGDFVLIDRRSRMPLATPALAAANSRSASRRNVALAFAAVYLIWGSTYLAIRIAIETIPPFLMAGIRFAIAGSALYAWARFRGVPRPTRVHWRSAAVIGGLLLFGGNGALAWAEQTVPSGLAAVLIATVPLWMAAFLWVGGRERPTPGAALGLPVGFAGVALLVAPWEFVSGGGVDSTGALVLMGASASWAAGSLYSRKASLPASPLLGTAMEMLAGAGVLVVAGTAAGEWSRFDLGSVSAASALAVVYLVTFGSLIAFTAYIWLLTVSPPAKVSTYAYVNPIVAVILGAVLAAEPLTARTLVSVAVILGSVVLITTYRSRLPTREKALA